MTWADGRLVAFDTETTGVDIESARIVSACVIHIQPGAEPDVHQWLIAPDIDIPDAAVAIHKITNERALTEGRPAAEVIPEIVEQLQRGWSAGGTVVGHNVGFDLSLLDREARRWLGRPLEIVGPVACSLVLDKATDRYRKGSRKLADVAAHHQVKQVDAHDATTDAIASARICWRIARVYPQVGDMGPRDLWRYQRQAAATQAAGLQDHLRRKARDNGEPVAAIEAIVIPTVWPIQPLPAATEPEGTPL